MSPEQAKILVVDDDPGLLRLVRLLLITEGFDVTTAEDGIIALERMETSEPDLVVMDLQMPRMDGRTLAREMRSRGYDVPVVVLSAYGAESAGRELSASAALRKPFDTEVLVDAIRSALDAAAT